MLILTPDMQCVEIVFPEDVCFGINRIAIICVAMVCCALLQHASLVKTKSALFV